jgi:putative two-component system response regulator
VTVASAISILVVDDQEANVRLLLRILKQAGYTSVRGTTDPSEALAIAKQQEPDLVLLDLHMPDIGGVEFMHALRRMPGWWDPFVIILTGDDSMMAKEHALSNGARDFIAKPFEINEVILRIKNLADLRTLHKELYASNVTLEQKVRARTAELEHARLDIMDRLGMAAEFRDDATGQHTRRVGKNAAMLARALGLPASEVGFIERAAPLHDVGKIAIPDHILLKPARLNADEMNTMRTHTIIGARLLSGSPSPLLDYARVIALTHHERWDGTGYPRGLAGTDIPLAGRIVAIADFYDALSHDRPYRKRRPHDEVLTMLRAGRGTHFDPDVVDAFLPVLEGSKAALPGSTQ